MNRGYDVCTDISQDPISWAVAALGAGPRYYFRWLLKLIIDCSRWRVGRDEGIDVSNLDPMFIDVLCKPVK